MVDDDNDDDEKEAEDQVFSYTGVRFGGETGLKTTRDSCFSRSQESNENDERTTTATKAHDGATKTRAGKKPEEEDPRQDRSGIRLGRKGQLD